MKYADSLEDVEVIKTGLLIDKLTGVGGIPRGVITELFGDEGIGKSSLSLQIVAEAQKQGIKCLWADVEYSYSPFYAASLGVDNKKLGIIRAQFSEPVLDEVEEEIESGKWGLVVFDSVGGITPKAEVEKGAEGRVIGAQAGLVARFCRKIVPLLSMNKVAFIAINHQFVDIMASSGRAPKIKTSGGMKLAYHKSLSIRLKSKGDLVKQGDKVIGKVVVGEVRKNKLAATERMELEGTIIFGQGFSKAADIFNDLESKGEITKEGQFYLYKGEKIGRGLTKAREWIKEHQDAILNGGAKV